MSALSVTIRDLAGLLSRIDIRPAFERALKVQAANLETNLLAQGLDAAVESHVITDTRAELAVICQSAPASDLTAAVSAFHPIGENR